MMAEKDPSKLIDLELVRLLKFCNDLKNKHKKTDEYEEDIMMKSIEHFRKNFFLVKKSKFWLRSPPEAPETPEMDCNMPH